MVVAIAQTLPPELLYPIFLHFRVVRPVGRYIIRAKRPEPRTDSVYNEPTLFACSLVCKSWRGPAVALLFTTLSVVAARDDYDAQLPSLLEFAAQYPSICPRVRRINITPPPPFPPFLSRPARIAASTFLAALRPFPRLCTLHLKGEYDVVRTQHAQAQAQAIEYAPIELDQLVVDTGFYPTRFFHHIDDDIKPFFTLFSKVNTLYVVGEVCVEVFFNPRLIVHLRTLGLRTLRFEKLTLAGFTSLPAAAIDSVEVLHVGASNRCPRWELGFILPNVKHLILGGISVQYTCKCSCLIFSLITMLTMILFFDSAQTGNGPHNELCSDDQTAQDHRPSR